MMELHRRCAVCRGLLVRFSSRTRNSPLSRPVIFIAAMVLPTWEQYYTATLFCTKHHENRSSASEGVEKYNLSNSIGRLAWGRFVGTCRTFHRRLTTLDLDPEGRNCNSEDCIRTVGIDDWSSRWRDLRTDPMEHMIQVRIFPHAPFLCPSSVAQVFCSYSGRLWNESSMEKVRWSWTTTGEESNFIYSENEIARQDVRLGWWVYIEDNSFAKTNTPHQDFRKRGWKKDSDMGRESRA